MKNTATNSVPVEMVETLDEIAKRVAAVAQPERVLLFGSAVSGKLGPGSDIDILVIVKDPVHRRKLAQEIYRNLHGIQIPVDVIVATESDVQEYGDKVGTILRPALLHGKVIYEAD